jgi:protein-disulfide isomerase
MDFPLESIHPQAFKAHEAAHCAGDQQKYWEMHHRLFANQRALGVDDLHGHARALGLDAPGFRQCLGGGKHAPRVRRDLETGQRLRVTGTPTFFLGWAEPGNQVRLVRRIVGAQPYAAFKDAIDALLAERK